MIDAAGLSRPSLDQLDHALRRWLRVGLRIFGAKGSGISPSRLLREGWRYVPFVVVMKVTVRSYPRSTGPQRAICRYGSLDYARSCRQVSASPLPCLAPKRLRVSCLTFAPRLHFGNLRSAVLLERHFRFSYVRSRSAPSCAKCVNRAIEHIVR